MSRATNRSGTALLAELTPVMAIKRICPICRPNEHHQAGNPPGRQAPTGFAMAARPVVRNRSAGDIQRQRALDYHHAAGGGNRTARICIGPAVGEADRAMGQLHRVPCVILLRRSYLAQSSRGVRKGALLRPQSSSGQPFSSVDVGSDSSSNGYPVRSYPARQRIRCQGGGDPLCRHCRCAWRGSSCFTF